MIPPPMPMARRRRRPPLTPSVLSAPTFQRSLFVPNEPASVLEPHNPFKIRKPSPSTPHVLSDVWSPSPPISPSPVNSVVLTPKKPGHSRNPPGHPTPVPVRVSTADKNLVFIFTLNQSDRRIGFWFDQLLVVSSPPSSASCSTNSHP